MANNILLSVKIFLIKHIYYRKKKCNETGNIDEQCNSGILVVPNKIKPIKIEPITNYPIQEITETPELGIIEK